MLRLENSGVHESARMCLSFGHVAASNAPRCGCRDVDGSRDPSEQRDAAEVPGQSGSQVSGVRAAVPVERFLPCKVAVGGSNPDPLTRRAEGDPPSLAGGSGCDDLDPVPPGIRDVEASLARDLRLVGPSDLDACIDERRGKLTQCLLRADEKGRMRLRGGCEGIVDTDVQLRCPGPKPAAPAQREQ